MKTKRILLIIALFLGATVSVYSQSQGEMNKSAHTDFVKADAEMNRVYKKILGVMEDADKKEFIVCQRAWLAYRDSQSAFYADFVARGGTMRAGLYYANLTELTEKRIQEMKQATAVK